MSAVVIPPSGSPVSRGLSIRNIIPRLPERGKIKIGGLGQERKAQNSNRTYQLPVKYNHFVVTTMTRGADGNFMPDPDMVDRFGDKPTSLPVRLLYDEIDLNFPTRYACYKGRTLWCTGDGEFAQRLDERSGEHHQVTCTCPLADPSIKRGPTDVRCKMNGSLSVIIDGAAGIGGVWKFRTTSYNSITGMLGSMAFIRQITGGPLANIPLTLTVKQQQGANPVDGSAVTIYVVGLEFAGDMDMLRDRGYQIALSRATSNLRIEHIEEEARRVLLLPRPPTNAVLPGDDAEDVVAEFYSEQSEQMAGSREAPPAPRREDFRDNPASDAGTGEVPADQSEAQATAEGPGPTTTIFEVIGAGGVVTVYDNDDEAADVIRDLLKGAETAEDYDAILAENQKAMEAFAAAGRDDLETEIKQVPRPASASPRQPAAQLAQPATEPQQQNGLALAGGAVSPTQKVPPRDLAVPLRKPPGKEVDYEETRGDMCALIMDLRSVEEVTAFRQVNRLALAAMQASYKQGFEQVEKALSDKLDTLAARR